MYEIELFYMRGCPHCVAMEPEWAKLEKMVPKGQIHKYEANEHSQKMDDENVSGFPTIKITKNGKKEEYKGPRTADAIFAEATGKQANGDSSNGAMPKQCGGGKLGKTMRNMKGGKSIIKDDEYYRVKYLKYKAKYMKLLAEDD